MKKTLYDYAEIIKKLPLKDKYTKEELLIEKLLIDKENNIEIYYAPHNDYINPKAKLMIIGITPGFIQMNTAIATARREFENNTSIEEIQYKCKIAGRFSGSLRKNLISMLDEIKLNEIFNLDSCRELFGKKDYLMHTVSLIPYPVFVKKQNYTGHSPKLLKSDFLMKYIYENFINEIHQLDNFEDILLIPLGKAVEEVLYKLKDENLIKEDQILRGFPHPSGANVNRLNQLEENKEQMINFLKKRTVS
ncbi:uracil-DNA glycosylase family protein [Terrisporobacter sp.]